MSLRLTRTAVCLVALLAALVPARAIHARAREVRYSDAHLHFVDYFQRTDGIRALLRAMDRAGVEHAMISGLPVTKKWAETAPREPKDVFADDANVYWYGMTDVVVARAVSELPPEDRARLHPFVCGFNPTDRNAVEHVERLLAWDPELWHGIGEIITRHDDLTALTDGETARADHPALEPIYRLAARHDLPVLIHSNVTSVQVREPLYLEELERVLAAHPDTRFLWAHAGTSAAIVRRIDLEFLDEEIERLLETHSNLWIDLSWSVLEEHVLEDGGRRADRRWVALIERYPDRFLVGSDAVGRFGRLDRRLGKFDELLEALDPETARLVARDNFISILPERVRDPESASRTGASDTPR